MILFLAMVHALYIVQTEDNVLHFLRENEEIPIPVSSLVRRPLGIMDDGKQSKCEELVRRNDYIVDSVKITKEGNIVVGNLCFPVDSIIEKPLIYFDTVFKAERRYNTVKLHGVVVFVVTLNVIILDLGTMYRKVLTYSYVYHPFESKKKISISDHYFGDKESFYSFDSRIVSVYESKMYQGNLYMSKIYNNEEIVTYKHPAHIDDGGILKYFVKFMLLVPILALGFYFFRRGRTLKISKAVFIAKGYKIHEGVFKREPVLVKIYKRRDACGVGEVKILRGLSHPGVAKLVFEETTLFKHILVFECSERFFSDDREQLKCVVDAVRFLHSRNIYHRSLCPNNIRIRNGIVFISNFEDAVEDSGDIGVRGWRSIDIIRSNLVKFNLNKEMCYKSDVFSLGLLLHYYLTGYHPFEDMTSEELDARKDPENFGLNEKMAARKIKNESKSGDSSISNFQSIPVVSNPFIYTKKSSLLYSPQKSHKNSFQIPMASLATEDMEDSGSFYEEEKIPSCKHDRDPKSTDGGAGGKSLHLEHKDLDSRLYSRPKERKINLEEVEMNITSSRYKLRTTNPIKHDLIYQTIKARYFERLGADELSRHPFFWADEKIFNFIANFSDIIEKTPKIGKRLENNRARIFAEPWNTYVDPIILQDLSSFRLYNFNRVRDLLRVIRNKGRHYNELPSEVKNLYKGYVSGFIQYWLRKFPLLLLICYQCGKKFCNEELLREFYS